MSDHSPRSFSYLPWLSFGVLWIILVLVFFRPLFTDNVLFSPDSAPFFSSNYQEWSAESLMGNHQSHVLGESSAPRPLHPLKALSILLPPQLYHIASYMLCTCLLYFGGLYYLRGRKVQGVALYMGALSLAFMGYAFSLVSAGHRDIFGMMPFMIFLFGALDRGIGRESSYHFALAGLFMAWGIASQPDIALLFGLLAAAYGLLKVILVWRAKGMRTVLFLGLRVLVGVLVFMALSLSSFSFLSKTVLPQRDAQRGLSPKEKWVFATNWSMPPEEMLEFFAPSIRGTETAEILEGINRQIPGIEPLSTKTPYWGRLGQSYQWKPGAPGFRNYRQHNMYIGGLQVLLALLAVGLAIAYRPSGDSRDQPEGDWIAHNRVEIFFWAGAAIVCLLLAMGRYFPLYDLLYRLPYLSAIRAPVKFVHLATVAITFLFGFGLHCLMLRFSQIPEVVEAASEQHKAKGGKSKKVKKVPQQAASNPINGVYKRMFWVSLVLALFLLGWWILAVGGVGPFDYWKQLGYGQHQLFIQSRMAMALLHGGIISAITAGLLFLGAKKKPWTCNLRLLSVLLLCVFLLDRVIVLKPFVRSAPMDVVYGPNPVADLVEAKPGNRMSDLVTSRSKFDPIAQSFQCRNIDAVDPRAGAVPDADVQALMQRLSKNPLKFWQISSTRYVFGASGQMKSLAGHPDFTPLGYFNTSLKGIKEAESEKGNTVVLEYGKALPRVGVYYDWKIVKKVDAAYASIASPAFDPVRSVLIVSDSGESNDSTAASTPAVIEKRSSNRIAITASVESKGVLMLNDRWHADWEVQVDGVSEKLLKCNAVMMGVMLEPGEHEVVFTYRPYKHLLAINLLGLLCMAGWTVFRLVKTRSGNKAP